MGRNMEKLIGFDPQNLVADIIVPFGGVVLAMALVVVILLNYVNGLT